MQSCIGSPAELYEENTPEFLALACREAVDFLRYYGDEALRLPAHTQARGATLCISPWNFPLAIFSGQIAAALAAGNAVLAKPAEQTPLIAAMAVGLMQEAGVPPDVLHLLPGDGATVGAALSAVRASPGLPSPAPPRLPS